MHTKLGTKANIHLWPLPRPWKRPMQGRGSELQLYQLHSKSTPGFGIENNRSSILDEEQVLRLITYTCWQILIVMTVVGSLLQNMHVCVCPSLFQLLKNLVSALFHWKTRQCHTSWFSTISNNNVVETQTCEIKVLHNKLICRKFYKRLWKKYEDSTDVIFDQMTITNEPSEVEMWWWYRDHKHIYLWNAVCKSAFTNWWQCVVLKSYPTNLMCTESVFNP